MSNRYNYKTEVVVTIAGIEHEWPATIVYARHKGFAGDRTNPPEPASVEIVDIKLNWSGDVVSLPAKIVDEFCEENALAAMLFQDWLYDEINTAEARAEYRAELIREERA